MARAGPLAELLQVRALCYCNRNRTDGFIPRAIYLRLSLDLLALLPPGTGQDHLSGVMVEARLWTQEGSDFQVHDYLKYQPAAKVQSLVEKRRERAALVGGRARAASAKRNVSGMFQSSDSSSEQTSAAPAVGIGIGIGAVSRVVDRGIKRDRGRAREAEIDGFDTWYSAYPVHVARRRAEKAFKAAMARGATPSEMVEAVQRQVTDREARAREKLFVPNWKNPEAWLNGDCWRDEPERAPKPAKWEAPEVRAKRGDTSGLAGLFKGG